MGRKSSTSSDKGKTGKTVVLAETAGDVIISFELCRRKGPRR